MSDDDFLAGFEACRLSRPEWTHESHVRMAWLYLTRYPMADAIERVRRGIRRLNDTFTKAKAASQVPHPPSSHPPKEIATEGYHDTITVAFIRLITARLSSNETFPAFRDRNPDLLERSLSALLRYYTKDRLNSAEARESFVEPDLCELPQ